MLLPETSIYLRNGVGDGVKGGGISGIGCPWLTTNGGGAHQKIEMINNKIMDI